MIPGALYSIVLTDGMVRVDPSPGGNKTAAPSGVDSIVTYRVGESPIHDLDRISG